MRSERCHHKTREGFRHGPPKHGGRSGRTRGSAAQASFPHLRQLMQPHARIANDAEGPVPALRAAAAAH